MTHQQISEGPKQVIQSKLLLRSIIVAGAVSLSSISSWALKVDISVSKVSQKMTVKVDGVTEYVWLVSTGGGKYETPSGNYKIFRMEKEHFSKEWDDAPMPYSMFFTGQGHAIHGSYHIARLGTKASHGCVRLAPENAAILFGLVQKAGYKNSTVSIKGGFFDSSPSLTTSNRPRKPFKWFWEKPKQQAADDALIKPLLKKKKKQPKKA
jgi:lipoprotein-anchoring transpeptidase ErfK/SrfK